MELLFFDILTPLPAFGVPFDIEEVRGPVIHSPIRNKDALKVMHPIDLEKLSFVGESLRILHHEVGHKAAVLSFVGAPWTIATYIVEGVTTCTYNAIKSMCHTSPHVLQSLLSHLTEAITEYIVYQVKSGAHCIQIFDSWGGQLTPHMWECWSKTYIKQIGSLIAPSPTLYLGFRSSIFDSLITRCMPHPKASISCFFVVYVI